MDRSRGLRGSDLKVCGLAPCLLLALKLNVPASGLLVHREYTGPGCPSPVTGRLNHPEEDTEALGEDKAGTATQRTPKPVHVCYLASRETREKRTRVLRTFQTHQLEAGSKARPDSVNQQRESGVTAANNLPSSLPELRRDVPQAVAGIGL